jgi:hypothetical protein
MRMMTGVLLVLSLAGPAMAMFECTVCHSKNPAMVTMHRALQGQGCFGCHKPGEKLMGKQQPKDSASLLLRRVTDPLCVPCHKRP